VNPIALAKRPDLYVENTRQITVLSSEIFGTFRYLEVGAFGVGSIIQTSSAGKHSKAAEKGFLISVMFTHYNEENEIKCIRQLYSSGVDAILLCSVQQSEQFVTFLKQLSIPVVSLGNKIDGISYVGADDFKAMEYLTAKVKEKHKKIVYYSPALKYENAYAQAERYQGFLNAIKDSPFETIKNPEELKEKYESGTAIISSTDVYAIYAYTHSCADKFYGFDNIPSLDRLKLPISSIEVDTADIAEKAINIIENEIDTDIFIPHKLIER
jgi:DNA-binding LacI/PurR family transcriptional regulator